MPNRICPIHQSRHNFVFLGTTVLGDTQGNWCQEPNREGRFKPKNSGVVKDTVKKESAILPICQVPNSALSVHCSAKQQ
jgi:hypothetical protein